MNRKCYCCVFRQKKVHMKDLQPSSLQPQSAYPIIALTKALLNDECTSRFIQGSVSFSSCLIAVLTIVYSYGVLKASVPTPSADMLTP